VCGVLILVSRIRARPHCTFYMFYITQGVFPAKEKAPKPAYGRYVPSLLPESYFELYVLQCTTELTSVATRHTQVKAVAKTSTYTLDQE